ncbi:MAG TPA: hypothetical protein VJX94_12435, partial [Stellaceae bacterium]|nr:hypothetical protein [Stellaceae bacterium]
AKRNVNENIYYSVNSLKSRMAKKAKKTDIDRAEYLHVDADPANDETSEAFLQRILPEVKKHKPPPTAVVASGNGCYSACNFDPLKGVIGVQN